MSDLLTDHLRWKGHQQGDSKLLEAADEIERLQAVLDAARAGALATINGYPAPRSAYEEGLVDGANRVFRFLDGEVKPSGKCKTCNGTGGWYEVGSGEDYNVCPTCHGDEVKP